MGKQKRPRQKYRSSLNKARKGQEDTQNGSDRWSPEVNESEGADDLVTTGTEEPEERDEEDAKSVRTVMSVSKSYKSIKRSIGSTMSKLDKRKLKHELFMKKVQLNHEILKETKNTKKGGNALPSTIAELDDLLPSSNMLHHQAPDQHLKEKIKQPKPVSHKIKGIKKAKQRQKDMEINIEAFKAAMADAKYKSSPLDVLTESVQERVFNQVV